MTGAEHALTRIIHDLDLIEVWRAIHPMDRQYSFHSGVHMTYTKLDYLFTQRNNMGRLGGAVSMPRLLSDHSPLCCEMDLLDWGTRLFSWECNSAALTDEIFRFEIHKEIVDFF